MLKRPGKKAFLELRYLLSVFQDDGVPADQIDTADMRIEIDADAWPVKACCHLLDVRGLAGAVMALHPDAAIMCKARPARERGVRIKHLGRIDIGYAHVRR